MSTECLRFEAEHTKPAEVRIIEALVQTGDTETPYRRAGSGAPILLLVEPGLFGESLLRALAPRFRVTAPRLPDEGRVPVSRWLRDTIDGLGLSRPHVVTGASLALAALGFSLMDPDRVGSLVTLERGPADPADPATALRDVLRDADRRLLMVRVDEAGGEAAGAAAAAGEVIRFLEG